jgi:hypothetical protein
MPRSVDAGKPARRASTARKVAGILRSLAQSNQIRSAGSPINLGHLLAPTQGA